MKKYMNISSILNVMAISVPFAYLTGYLYDIGYLEAYGFPQDAFPKSTEVYLINFFMVCIYFLSKILKFVGSGFGFFVFSSLVMIFSVFVAVLNRYLERYKIFIERCKNRLGSYKNLDITVIPVFVGSLFVIIPYALISIIAFFVIGLFGGYQIGQEIAKQEIGEFSCEKEDSCYSLYQNGELKARGRVIAISSDLIGVYTQNGIQLISNSDVHIKKNSDSK